MVPGVFRKKQIATWLRKRMHRGSGCKRGHRDEHDPIVCVHACLMHKIRGKGVTDSGTVCLFVD